MKQEPQEVVMVHDDDVIAFLGGSPTDEDTGDQEAQAVHTESTPIDASDGLQKQEQVDTKELPTSKRMQIWNTSRK
jgi:hypothetical protein